MVKQDIITVDGPSGSGKSTISKMLADRLTYTYLDTGAMYRAVGLKVKRSGVNLDASNALQKLLDETDIELLPGNLEAKVLVDGEDVSQAIRTAAMGMMASKVSALPQVREKLTAVQQQLGTQGKIVAEGRDMGTVVFPGAANKFYLSASPDERARRRTDQLKEKGMSADYQEILEQIKKRDHNDSTRELAPLKPAEDAIIVDSSEMTIEEVVQFMLDKIN